MVEGERRMDREKKYKEDIGWQRSTSSKFKIGIMRKVIKVNQ